MKSIILNKGKAKPFWHGHPLVFSGAIAKADSEISPGELVQVHDDQNRLIGVGIFNPHSSYRVRILARASWNIPHTSLAEILRHRFHQAIHLRQMLNLPNETTNAYRLINSEGDNLSGLTIDIYNDYCVIAATAYWVMQNQGLINTLCNDLLPNKKIIWRPHLKSLQQDGYTQTTTDATEKIMIRIIESNVLYDVPLHLGQKTGFYFDQRENRLLIQQLAHNKSVLDACCYTGAFSIHAALGGASRVIGIDSSAPAIERAKHNAKINKVQDHIEFIEADTLTFLKTKPQVDFIILDPPKLAPSHKHLTKATKHYKALNQAAMECFTTAGLLFTCTCSQAMSSELFLQMLHDAAISASRTIKILSIARAAPDHVITSGFFESDYFFGVLLYVEC